MELEFGFEMADGELMVLGGVFGSGAVEAGVCFCCCLVVTPESVFAEAARWFLFPRTSELVLFLLVEVLPNILNCVA